MRPRRLLSRSFPCRARRSEAQAYAAQDEVFEFKLISISTDSLSMILHHLLNQEAKRMDLAQIPILDHNCHTCDVQDRRGRDVLSPLLRRDD